VRFSSLFVFFLFAVSITAHAQVQEQRISHILHPDEKKAFDLDNAKFFGTKGFSGTTKVTQSKEFQFDQKFSPKAFNAATYSGTKGAWLGDMKFSTKSASTSGKYEIPNAGKAADTKALPIKDYVYSDKAVATKIFPGQRPFLKRGPSQDLFDKEKGYPSTSKPIGFTGDLRPMTIDDVRTLLNKNK